MLMRWRGCGYRAAPESVPTLMFCSDLSLSKANMRVVSTECNWLAAESGDVYGSMRWQCDHVDLDNL
eukprot:COSAG02_NODE_107_length_36312_cov_45.037942_27_plen_67_part_00